MVWNLNWHQSSREWKNIKTKEKKEKLYTLMITHSVAHEPAAAASSESLLGMQTLRLPLKYPCEETAL